MSIFSRFMDIVNSNINAILDKAEDPEKMLRLMIQEMEDTLIELKSNCAGRMAEEIKLERKKKEAENAFSRWASRAMLAVEKKREDLAREALVEKRKAKGEIDRINLLLEQMKATIEETKKEIETLEEKMQSAKSKLRILRERQERAENERKSSVTGSADFDQRFSDMEEKIDRMNAENEMRRRTSADEKFQKMEEDEEIEKELEELKKKVEI